MASVLELPNGIKEIKTYFVVRFLLAGRFSRNYVKKALLAISNIFMRICVCNQSILDVVGISIKKDNRITFLNSPVIEIYVTILDTERDSFSVLVLQA